MEFRELCTFDNGGCGVFWSHAGGPGPWEMHPDCDELLQTLEGEIQLEVLPASGGASIATIIKSGSFLVIPKGCWHRQNFLTKSKELYITPGQTLHSNAEDPRNEILRRD